MTTVHENLEEISRKLVEVQLDVQRLSRDTEPMAHVDVDIKDCTSEYHLGPPQVIKFVIPEFLPRLKVHPGLLAKKNHLHPTTYGAVRDRWFNLIGKTIQRDILNWYNYKPFEKAIVWIHMYVLREDIDVDNFTTKFVNDALVFLKIFKDDNCQLMITITSAEAVKDNPRTQIMVREGWEINEIYSLLSGRN